MDSNCAINLTHLKGDIPMKITFNENEMNAYNRMIDAYNGVIASVMSLFGKVPEGNDICPKIVDGINQKGPFYVEVNDYNMGLYVDSDFVVDTLEYMADQSSTVGEFVFTVAPAVVLFKKKFHGRAQSFVDNVSSKWAPVKEDVVFDDDESL